MLPLLSEVNRNGEAQGPGPRNDEGDRSRRSPSSERRPCAPTSVFRARTAERCCREAPRIISHVRRPARRVLVEPTIVAGEERSRRLLEADVVTGHGGHEAVGRLTRLPDDVTPAAR